ncbi:hypothetical protein [Streptomyces albogriseolus]|uniref:hypothetical protein n=1 Tax=Streptomyces albogriseolus TaxID=1887 RepID=UPI0034607492
MTTCSGDHGYAVEATPPVKSAHAGDTRWRISVDTAALPSTTLTGRTHTVAAAGPAVSIKTPTAPHHAPTGGNPDFSGAHLTGRERQPGTTKVTRTGHADAGAAALCHALYANA